MQQKTRLFNLWDVAHKEEEEAEPEHAIGLHPRKTIYLDILTTHTHLIYINSLKLYFLT